MITAQDIIATDLSGAVSGLTRAVIPVFSATSKSKLFYWQFSHKNLILVHYRIFTMFKAFNNVVIRYILQL